MNKILWVQLSRENPVEMENILSLQLWFIIHSVPLNSSGPFQFLQESVTGFWCILGRLSWKSRPGEASLLQMSCSTQAAFHWTAGTENCRRWVRNPQHWLTTVGKELCNSEQPRSDLSSCFSRTDGCFEDACTQIPCHEVPRQEDLLVNQSYSDPQNSKFAHFPWTRDADWGRFSVCSHYFFAQLQLSCSFFLIKNSISDPLFDRL